MVLPFSMAQVPRGVCPPHYCCTVLNNVYVHAFPHTSGGAGKPTYKWEVSTYLSHTHLSNSPLDLFFYSCYHLYKPVCVCIYVFYHPTYFPHRLQILGPPIIYLSVFGFLDLCACNLHLPCACLRARRALRARAALILWVYLPWQGRSASSSFSFLSRFYFIIDGPCLICLYAATAIPLCFQGKALSAGTI